MKKIVLAFDGTNFSKSVLQYADALNEDRQALVVGVFVNGLYNYPVPVFYEGMVSMNMVRPDAEEEGLMQKHVDEFESFCREQGIDFRVHKVEEGNVMDELVYETRYADLAIVSGNNFLKHSYEKYVNENVQMFLEDAECPVLMVPDHYLPVDTIVMAYDSSDSAIKAIKEFGHVLGELSSRESFLVKVVSQKEEGSFSFGNRMEEYLSRHFSKLSLTVLQGKPAEGIKDFLKHKKNPMLVIGAYGRGFFSQLLRKSLAHDIIVEHKLPVFIYH